MNNKDTLYSIGVISIFSIFVYFGLQDFFDLTIASLFGFLFMCSGYVTGLYIPNITPFHKSVFFGLGSGSMLMSAFLVIVPKAVSSSDSILTSVGAGAVAIGFIFGYLMHETSHVYSHMDMFPDFNSIPFFEISLHSLLAGVLMGITYSTIPEAGLLLGFSILAHKFPAGLLLKITDSNNTPLWLYLLPATLVGFAGLLVAYTFPQNIPSLLKVISIGLSAGLFIHVAIDMTPECVGADDGTHSHGKIICSSNTDKYRLISAFSVTIGAVLILCLWFAVRI